MRRTDDGYDLLPATIGMTLLDVIRPYAAGLGRIGVCGGQGACGTCRVLFEPSSFERLPAAKGSEVRLLTALPGHQAHHRLACQIRFDADLDGLAFAPAPIM